MKQVIRYTAVCDRGKYRKDNQERIFVPHCAAARTPDHVQIRGSVEENCAFFAVFDGMGGEQFGAKAADLAEQTLRQNEHETDCLRLLDKMNAAICAFSRQKNLRCMGSTAALVSCREGAVQVCNIGDSRIYRFHDGVLEQLSADHAVIRFGKRMLTQHLGIAEEEFRIEPAVRTVCPASGDRLLLCSDGLTDMVPDRRIEQILRQCAEQQRDPGAALLDEALRRGGRDNISVIVCAFS